MNKNTPGPWRVEDGTTLIWGRCDPDDETTYGMGFPVAEAKTNLGHGSPFNREFRIDEVLANATLIAAAPEMLAALRLHQAWSDSERSGPDYGGQTRDTHPDGERIWRAWWENQLDLCGRAQAATKAVLALLG